MWWYHRQKDIQPVGSLIEWQLHSSKIETNRLNVIISHFCSFFTWNDLSWVYLSISNTNQYLKSLLRCIKNHTYHFKTCHPSSCLGLETSFEYNNWLFLFGPWLITSKMKGRWYANFHHHNLWRDNHISTFMIREECWNYQYW